MGRPCTVKNAKKKKNGFVREKQQNLLKKFGLTLKLCNIQ